MVPGDVVVGDDEGVVVVPAALADEVAADAVQQELEEEWALERVAAGESTVGVFPIAADRRAEFEAWAAHRTAGRLMTRRSIDIEGFHHTNPIPAASRVGPLLVSSVVAARDPGSDRVPDDPRAQIANLFGHVDAMLRRAAPTGATSSR